MTKTNILMSRWISQIRKILQDNPKNHIYLISQTMRKIDVDFRELAQLIAVCRKYQIKEKTYIKRTWYAGINGYMTGKKLRTDAFLGNPYFKNYTTEEIIKFSDLGEYI